MSTIEPTQGPPPGPWLRFMSGPARHPRSTLIVTTLLLALAILAMRRLSPNASVQALLGDQNPGAAALQYVMEDFSSADELLVLATAHDTSAPEDERLARLRSFAQAVDAAIRAEAAGQPQPVFLRVTYAATPQMVEFFTKEAVPAGLLYLSDNEVATLRERLTPAAMREQLRQDEAMIAAPGPAADALARTLVKDPLRLREFLGSRLNQARAGFRTFRSGPEFISQDATRILIRIAGSQSPSDLNFCKRVVREAQRLIMPLGSTHGVRVELSGAYAIAAASEHAVRRDLIESVVASIILMQLAFLIGYRSVLSFPLAFLPIAISVIVAFGVYALIDPSLTPLTAVIGAMIVGCGIDYSVYVISYYETARARGLVPREASVGALRDLAWPLVTSSLTSVVGFAAVAFSSVRALREFALLGALGLAFALLGSMWVLPALLTVTSRLGRLVAPGPRIDFGRVVGSLDRRRRGLALASFTVMAAAGLVVILKGLPRFETDLNVMHPTPNAPLETERTIAATYGSADTMIVHIQGADDAALVATAHRVEAALANSRVRETAGISGTFGVPLLVPGEGAGEGRAFDIDRVLADFDSAVSESRFDAAAFEGYKGFLRTLLTARGGPTVETLRQYPDLSGMLLAKGGKPAAITLVQRGSDLRDTVERDRAVESLRAALADIPGVTLTGMGVVGYDVERSVRRDLPVFLGVAGAAVVGLLLLSYRSIGYTLLSLLPLAFGGTVLLAVMALTGERFNLANTVGLPLLMGVGVDYGIFLVSMTQQSRRVGEPRAGLLARFGASFHAIVHTGFVTFIGFGTLAFTSTPAVQSLGRVIAIGVGGCVLATFVLLAPVLLLIPSKSNVRVRSEEASR